MEREQLDSRTNGKEAAPVAPPPVPNPIITVEEINGRIQELQDQNSLLSARCAEMRGQMARKDKTIEELRAMLVEASKDKSTVLSRQQRRNGRK